MCQERRKGLGTGQNPEDISKIVFPEEVLRLSNNSGFLLTDHTDDAEENNSCLRLGRWRIFTENQNIFLKTHLKIFRGNSHSCIAYTWISEAQHI